MSLTDVVYALECPCKKLYIGSTIHKANKQVLEHLRAIGNKDPTYSMAWHFSEHYSNRDLLSFFVIDHVPVNERGGKRTLKLRKLESKYIIELETKGELGWNMEEEIRMHL